MILLTNDDGIDAPGLDALRCALPPDHGPAIRVAPLGAWSNGSHALTTHRPIRIDRRDDSTLAVDGSPADCVRLAIAALNLQPAWVLSGINPGGNLGTDAWPSGTLAAAREAALHGLPAIAISHYIAPGRSIDWDRATVWTRAVLDRLLTTHPRPGTFWSLNLPHPEPGAPLPEIVLCPPDPSPLPLAYSSTESGSLYSASYQSRPRRSNHDIDVCFNGQISLSLLSALPVSANAAEAGWP
jgi:5'-nucleotidase